MNDIKDIINKMKFVPQEMQDEVLKNIKKCIENEIKKSCDPIKAVVERLNELEFGKSDDEFKTNKIIGMIINSAPSNWFWMKPMYCRTNRITYEHSKVTDAVNPDFTQFIESEIRNLDDPEREVWLLVEIAQQANTRNIDVIEDSYWVWKDGANAEIWIHTTNQLAKEMLYWFEKCLNPRDDEDIEWAYKVLNSLEESFPKEE